MGYVGLGPECNLMERLHDIVQLLDVLNAHFQQVFGITKTQSTLLQLAYFGAYLVWSPVAGLVVS